MVASTLSRGILAKGFSVHGHAAAGAHASNENKIHTRKAHTRTHSHVRTPLVRETPRARPHRPKLVSGTPPQGRSGSAASRTRSTFATRARAATATPSCSAGRAASRCARRARGAARCDAHAHAWLYMHGCTDGVHRSRFLRGPPPIWVLCLHTARYLPVHTQTPPLPRAWESPAHKPITLSQPHPRNAQPRRGRLRPSWLARCQGPCPQF